MPDPRFIFATCQRGAEPALKAELQARRSQLHPSFSRPGFVTFKVTESDDSFADDQLNLNSIFARSLGWSLGKISGDENIREMAKRVVAELTRLQSGQFSGLHVWPRDAATMGFRSFEPGQTPESIEITQALRDELSEELLVTSKQSSPQQSSKKVLSASEPGDKKPHSLLARNRTLDIVIVGPTEWWIGWHTIRQGEPWTRWPGGIFTCDINDEIVSRAYVKMREALATFRLPINRGETVIEIGSSPGGASQALLQLGLNVIGVDPAKMHPTLLANRRFTHWQMRGHEIKKTRLKGVKWLTADLNVDPQYTLNTVEEIVTNQHVRIAGVLLTLKLSDWKLAEEIPAQLDQVRSWGFRFVRARQLSHNRQEYCIAALRKK